MNDAVKKATILLVDDEDMVLTLGRIILERRGYDVRVARSGAEAIAVGRAHEGPLDCVIIDYTMPEMNGRDTLMELRKIFTGIPAVISSGYSDAEIIQAMAGLEISGIIHKPYRQDALIAALERALSPS